MNREQKLKYELYVVIWRSVIRIPDFNPRSHITIHKIVAERYRKWKKEESG